jgi:tetratricopeptide (TPR) repeat protein
MTDKVLLVIIAGLALMTGYAGFEIWQNRESHPLIVQLLDSDRVTAETTNTASSGEVLPVSNVMRATPKPIGEQVRFSYLPIYKTSLIMKCRQLLREEEFEALNALLASLEVDAERDIANEERLFLAYDAFDATDAGIAEYLDKWVASTSGNYQPYLARATYNYGMGWKARGSKWASETKKEQFEEMNGYFGMASKDLEAALGINDKLMVTYSMLIKMMKTASDKESMVKVLNLAIEKNPASYEVRYSFINSITPRWSGSLDMMHSFAKYSQESVALNKRIGLLMAAPYIELGNLRSIENAYTKAVELFTKALNAGEYHVIYGERGEAYYRAGKYSEAVSDLSKALTLFPEKHRYYYWRSKAYYKLEKNEMALADSEAALMLAPDDEYNQRQHDRVVSKLERLGYEQAQQHKLDAALNFYDLALRSAPDNAAIYSRRASVYIDKNMFDAATDDMREAIRLDPKTYNYYKRIDWLLARERKWDQIIAYWDQYIALDPNESWAYVERGGAYYHKGDIKQAVHNAKIAADMGNEDGKKAYERFRHMVN